MTTYDSSKIELYSRNELISDFEIKSHHYAPPGDCACACDCACDCSRDCRYVIGSNIKSVIKNTNRDDMLFNNNCFYEIPYKLNDELFFKKINEFYFAVGNPKGNPSVTVVSNSVKNILEGFEKPKLVEIKDQEMNSLFYKLINAHILIPELGSTKTIINDNPNTLACWLNVTNECNLNCNYCYINQNKRKMSQTIGLDSIDFLFKEALKRGFEEIFIKYGGGEPTLCLELIEKLHKRVIEQSNRFEIKTDEVIMTNGVINKEQIKKIKSLGIRVMISLDAIDNFQNIQRQPNIKIDGCKITKTTLEELINCKTEVDVSVTVYNQSSKTLVELLDYLLHHEIPFSWNFARMVGNDKKNKVYVNRSSYLIETMNEVFSFLFKNPPKRSLLSSFLDRANLAFPHLFTCGYGMNYYVIRNDGEISRCQHEFDSPLTSIYDENACEKITKSESEKKNLPITQRTECEYCNWKFWCTGGCPLMIDDKTGRSQYCEVYKTLIPKLIKLEGIAILQQNRV